MQDGLSEIQPLVERVAVGNLRGELGEIGRYDATIRRAHRSRRDEERQEADLCLAAGHAAVATRLFRRHPRLRDAVETMVIGQRRGAALGRKPGCVGVPRAVDVDPILVRKGSAPACGGQGVCDADAVGTASQRLQTRPSDFATDRDAIYPPRG